MRNGTLVLVLALLCAAAGCERELNDPLYGQAKKYEETAFTLSSAAIAKDAATPERLAAIRKEAAVTAGFTSPEDARAQLKAYLESGDAAKVAVAYKIIDLAMKNNKEIEALLAKKRQSVPSGT
ncbi:MAG: hypothetical protein ABIF71_15495 [Planctomycetota bacterium]